MGRMQFWLGTALVTLSWPMFAWGQPRDADFYGPHMMWGGWYGMFFGPLMMIIFIAVVIVLVVLSVRWIGGSHGPSQNLPPSSTKTLLDSLRERFARGEIDKEELTNFTPFYGPLLL